MTTTVKVTCGGDKYRAKVVDSRYPDSPTYVVQADGEKHFGVGSDNKVEVSEEYIDDAKK